MEKRKCVNGGLELPALGIGCWAFGGGEYWGDQSQRDVDDVVAGAIEAGCTYFDTAEAYNNGASESSLGLALRGRRDKAVIGTKVSPSNCYPQTLREHCDASLKRLHPTCDAQTLREHCETRLKRLGTDYIDLYMVHWPIHPHSIRHFTNDEKIINNPPVLAEAFDTLNQLQREGKIRHVGVSNFATRRLAEAMELATIAVNELPYSLLTRAIEYESLPQCRRAGVGVIGYMTLLQGLLADIYPTLKDVPPYQRRTRHFHHSSPDSAELGAAGRAPAESVKKSCELCRHGEEGAEDLTEQAIAAIRAIAKECGMTMPEIALKWALAGEGITCALVGARNRKELTENVRAASGPLAPDVVEKLNAATAPLMERLGRGFDYYENTRNDRTL